MTNTAEHFQSHRFFPEVEHFRNIARLHRLPTGFPECLGALPVRISQDHSLRSGFTELFRRMQQTYPDFSLGDAVWILLTAIGGQTAANRQVAPDGVFDFAVSFVTSIGGWPESRRSSQRTPESHRSSPTDQRGGLYDNARGTYDNVRGTELSTRWNGSYQSAAPTQEDALASIADTLARLERSTAELRQHLDSVEHRLAYLEPLLDTHTSQLQPAHLPAPQHPASHQPPTSQHAAYLAERATAPEPHPPAPPAPLVHRSDAPPAISPVPQAPAAPVTEPAMPPPAATVRAAPRPRFAAAMDLPQTNSSFAAPFQHGAAPLRPAPPEPPAPARQPAPEQQEPVVAAAATPDPPRVPAATSPDPELPPPAPSDAAINLRPEPPSAELPPAPPSSGTRVAHSSPDSAQSGRPLPASMHRESHASAPQVAQAGPSAAQLPRPASTDALPLGLQQARHTSGAPVMETQARWPAAPASSAPAPAPAAMAQSAAFSSVLTDERPESLFAPASTAPAATRTPQQDALPSRLTTPPTFGTDLFGQHSPQDHDDAPARSRTPVVLGLFAALVVSLALGVLARGRPLPSWTHFAPHTARPAAAPAPTNDPTPAADSNPSAPATPPAHTADPAIPGKVLGARAEDTDHTSEQVLRNPTFVPELTLRSHLVSGSPALFPRSPGGAAVRGTVVLKIIVARDGTVDDVTVLGGPKSLRDAAVNAVREWRFQPTLVHGAPAEVRSVLHVPVEPPDGR